MPIKNGLLHYKLRKTVFGQITVIWEEEPNFKVKRILLPTHSVNVHIKYPKITSSTNAVINDFAEDIKKFLAGEVIHFDINILDLNSCSSFQKKVLQAEYGIPRGWISTYGKIANHIGNINAARAVGRALASNPFPIAIPCHRAIRKNGELSGYQGGVEMKRSLLKMEGIKFTISGRALLDKIYYSN
jgi:methylated-DNA-[protein]-cysteine S-methyltransferase